MKFAKFLPEIFDNLSGSQKLMIRRAAVNWGIVSFKASILRFIAFPQMPKFIVR
jgi:hypothetical protein